MKSKTSISLILIALALIVFTSTYTHYEVPQNNDEWNIACISKDIISNGHLTKYDPLHSGDISRGWASEISRYPRGLHILVSYMSITSGLAVFNTLVIFSVFNRLLLCLLAFCLGWALFKKYDVAFLSAILIALIPSWGTGLGPMYVVASSFAYLIMVTLLIFSTRHVNKKYLFLAFICSLCIVVSHRTSTLILFLLIAVFLPRKDSRLFWVFSMIGAFCGIIVNMAFFDYWNPAEFLPIDVKWILLLSCVWFIFSSVHQKYITSESFDMNVKNLLRKRNILLLYFLLMGGLTVYIIYVAWGSPLWLGYFMLYTKPGYVLFGLLTVGYLGYISLFYSFFIKDKHVSKLALFIAMLLITSFFYFVEFAPARTQTAYPRLFIYSALLLVPFTSKFVIDMLKEKNRLVRLIVCILLVAALPYGTYGVVQSAHPGYYDDVKDVSELTMKIISQTPHLNEMSKITITGPTKYMQGVLYYNDPARFDVFSYGDRHAYWLNRHIKSGISDLIIVPNTVQINEEYIAPPYGYGFQAQYEKAYSGDAVDIYIKIVGTVLINSW